MTTFTHQSVSSLQATVSRFVAATPRFVRFAFVTVFFAVLFLLYRRYAMTFVVNTDFASFFLQGDAALHGNPLLSHYYATTVSWYTGDVLFYALGVAVRGFNPALLYDVPVGVFCVSVGLCLYLAGKRYNAPRSVWGMVAAFILVGLPVRQFANMSLLGPLHNGTVLWLLAGLACIDTTDEDNSLPFWRLAGMTVCFGAAVLADSMALFIGVLPLLMALVIRWRRGVGNRRRETAIALGVVAATFAARAALKIIPAIGGFKMPIGEYSTKLSFISFQLLPQNISWTIEGLLLIYGADFFGMPLGLAALGALLGLAGLGAVAYAFYRTIALWCSRTTENQVNLISAFLVLSMTINIVSYAFSTAPLRFEALRYLGPFVYMGAILVGRLGLVRVQDPRRYSLVLAVAGVVALFHFVSNVKEPRAESSGVRLGNWLVAHNLRAGYAVYWASLDVTALTRKKVQVYPIVRVSDKSRQMQPFYWATDERWYKDRPANYVVVSKSADTGGVTRKSVEFCFGPPVAAYPVEDYTVMVYDHDLTPLLDLSHAPGH